MIYSILGALAVGLSLGLFGSGGSILTVPVLIYLLHHGSKVAIAESLAVVGAIALIGSLRYARAGWVDWRIVILFGVPGMGGTYAGAWIAGYVSGVVQLFVFAGVMLLAAVQMWRSTGKHPLGVPTALPARRSIVKIALDGVAVGILTGFVGVGGGFLIVPALVLLGGLGIRRAVATSLVIIALKSMVGFWKYLDVLEALDGTVDWTTIAVFVVVGVAGSFAGASIGGRINSAALQRGFSIFLILMAGFILARETVAIISTPSASEVVAQEQKGDT